MRLTFATCISLVFVGASCGQSIAPGQPDRIMYEADFTGGDAHGWRPANSLEPFTLDDGHLATRATGDDAHMMVSDLSLPTTDISHLRFRLRSDRPGVTQVYFATTTSPDPAAHGVPAVSCSGDDQWHDYEVALAGVKGFLGTLTMLRLDPVNGGGEQAGIGLQWVHLILKAPVVACEGFAADEPMVRPGRPFVATLRLTNLGGQFAGALSARLTARGVTIPQPDVQVQWSDETHTGRASWTIQAGLATMIQLQAVVLHEGKTVLRAQTCVAVRDESTLSDLKQTNTPTARVFGAPSNVRLVFVGNTAKQRRARAYCAAVVQARIDGAWKPVGLLSPLAQIAYVRDGVECWEEPPLRFSDADSLQAEVEGAIWQLRLGKPAPVGDAGARCVEFQSAVRKAPGPVRRVSGPILRVGLGPQGHTKSAALFPGIEFLGEDEPSANTDVVGLTVGYRPSPAPLQVTVPLLAVLKDDVLTGLMWPPGDANRLAPVGEFASPNFLDGQSNHRLGCFLPSFSRPANQPIAKEPSAGDAFSIKTVLFTAPGAEITDAVPLWYHVFGRPKPPAPPHSPREALDLCIQGWAQTLWFPQERGFNNHWRIGQTPYWDAGLAANVLAHHWATGEQRWMEALKLSTDDTILGLVGSIFTDLKRPDTPSAVQTQRQNGLWPYEPPADLAEKVEGWTGGKRSDLGQAGSFNVGVAANHAVGILSHALRWGNGASKAAGLKALAAMDKFRVPRGCQGWEVHIDIPDIYAAARIVDCYRMGYQLTGNEHWLDRARYWAYTGLPFLYAYRVPGTGPGASAHIPWPRDVVGSSEAVFEDPQVHHPTPWASIPVFGTSFYRVSWFGNPVQWCGLCWAGSVYGLLELREDEVLRAAADGVVISGIHQTFDKQPYVGLLPDTWHLSSNTAHPALIGPVRLETPLRLMIDEPEVGRLDVAVARHADADATAHISSRGQVAATDYKADRLGWTQRFPIGQVCETLAIVKQTPRGVSADGRELPRVDDILTADEGWQPLPQVGGLGIRLKHTDQRHNLVVTF